MGVVICFVECGVLHCPFPFERGMGVPLKCQKHASFPLDRGWRGGGVYIFWGIFFVYMLKKL